MNLLAGQFMKDSMHRLLRVWSQLADSDNSKGASLVQSPCPHWLVLPPLTLIPV